MGPRSLGVELLCQDVELGLGFVVRFHGHRVDRFVAAVSVRRAGSVDVDVLSLSICREELDSEIVEQGVQSRLVRRYPLAAELVRLPADLGVPEPAADAVARLEHHDLLPSSNELRGSCQAGDPGSYHHDVRSQLTFAQAPPLSSERCCCRAAPGANRAFHVAGDPLVGAADVERRSVRPVERADAHDVPRPPMGGVAARVRIRRPEPDERLRCARDRGPEHPLELCLKDPFPLAFGHGQKPRDALRWNEPRENARRAAATSKRAGAARPPRGRSRRCRPRRSVRRPSRASLHEPAVGAKRREAIGIDTVDLDVSRTLTGRAQTIVSASNRSPPLVVTAQPLGATSTELHLGFESNARAELGGHAERDLCAALRHLERLPVLVVRLESGSGATATFRSSARSDVRSAEPAAIESEPTWSARTVEGSASTERAQIRPTRRRDGWHRDGSTDPRCRR